MTTELVMLTVLAGVLGLLLLAINTASTHRQRASLAPVWILWGALVGMVLIQWVGPR